jgi:nitric oxide reductase large subunit
VEGPVRGIAGFVFYSVVALAPVLVAAFVVSRFRRRDRLIGLAPLAVVIGFLAGGAVGWAAVPPVWTASFSTTIEAAANAAKYGESFEHAAEQALMYFFWSALLGEIVFGAAALLFLWRIAVPPSAKPLP